MDRRTSLVAKQRGIGITVHPYFPEQMVSEEFGALLVVSIPLF